jgi:hypothetical protein
MHPECEEKRSWEEIAKVYKAFPSMFSTGGLGSFATSEFRVWACFQSHSCLYKVAPASYTDFMCYMYHETTKTWFPWGLKSEIQQCQGSPSYGAAGNSTGAAGNSSYSSRANHTSSYSTLASNPAKGVNPVNTLTNPTVEHHARTTTISNIVAVYTLTQHQLNLVAHDLGNGQAELRSKIQSQNSLTNRHIFSAKAVGGKKKSSQAKHTPTDTQTV